jgi:hypothetical protein
VSVHGSEIARIERQGVGEHGLLGKKYTKTITARDNVTAYRLSSEHFQAIAFQGYA